MVLWWQLHGGSLTAATVHAAQRQRLDQAQSAVL